MLAVAVRGLDKQQVGFRHHRVRVAQHRATGHAEVAGEYQGARTPFTADRYLQPGRTENVAGVMEADLDRLRRGERFAIGDGTQQLERRQCLGHRVQRRRDAAFALATAVAMAQLPLGLLFLNVRAVRQQHLEQIADGRRRLDRPAEPENRQAWQ